MRYKVDYNTGDLIPMDSSAINPSVSEIDDFPSGVTWIEDDNRGHYNYYIKINNKSYLIKSIDIVPYSLCFSSDEPFTLSVNTPGWDGTLEYSIDEGNTWTTWNGSQLSRSANQPIYIRGIRNTVITGNSGTNYNWVFTGKYCTGNIETLLDYQTVANGQHPVMGYYCYQYMFRNCTSLTTAPELLAITLADACYQSMFSGCTSLTTSPQLPATTLTAICYKSMFYGCRSLTIAPSLPATTLAENCYTNMFNGCISLITVPSLPATRLTYGCYQAMFSGCTSLTTAPKLSATTLASYCYDYMFENCTSLTTIPELPATTLVGFCYSRMFDGCTSLKISTTQTPEYQYAYRIPTSDTGTDATHAFDYMFDGTGGTFTGTPIINTTYYTDHQPV